MVAAFAAVAHNEDLIGGRIKITAFEDVPRAAGSASSNSKTSRGSRGSSGGSSSSSRSDAGPPPGTVNLLAFPAGLCAVSVPLCSPREAAQLPVRSARCTRDAASLGAPLIRATIPFDPLASPGVRFTGLSVEQLGLAVAVAAADEPAEVPLTAEQRRELQAREVRVARTGGSGGASKWDQTPVGLPASTGGPWRRHPALVGFLP